MKLIHRSIDRGGVGTVKVVPQESDDLWHAYNLIAVGDTCTAVTFRKVLKDLATGGRDSEKMKIKLEVIVQNVEYDKGGPALRVKGKVISKNEFVNAGSFHTLEIEQNRSFVLKKDLWDSVALDILKRACEPAASADLAVVLLQEGLAHIFLIGESITVTSARIESSIPRKYGRAVAGYEKALNKFFEKVMQAFLRKIDFKVVRCVVIASPGFIKDQFREYLLLAAERQMVRSIIENKSRIILAHATSGYKHSLRETLLAPGVVNMIKDTKAAKEVQALNEFFNMLSTDESRACYGPKHVDFANEERAIQTLLITDELFRNSDFQMRKKYVDLVESVKASGGSVHIFSAMHPSGEQLGQITGIAAILRFPVHELDEIEM